MTNHSKHFRRQLLVMVAVLLGATLLLVGIVPPQEAQSKEKKNDAAQSSQEERQTTTPAENGTQSEEQEEEAEKTTPAEDEVQSQDQEEGEKTTPAESDEAQNKWVLDKDPEGNEYIAGELLVTYKKDAFNKAKDEAPKKISAKVEKDFPEIEVQHVSVPEVKNEQAQEARQKALERKKKDLEQDPDVEAVGYNYVGYGTMTPSDPGYGQQWAPPKLNAPQAWDVYRGSSNIKIAILDSGIDRNHPDLQGKVVGQKDFVNNDSDASDDVGTDGHGTLSAGIVAAPMNNGEGMAGTCPNCSLLVGKVLDKNNSLGTTWAWAISGIDWAASNGANVINMSFGGTKGDIALERAVNNAWDKGAVVVGAAGNDGTSSAEFYPAAYEKVIAVAATDKNDYRAVYDWRSGAYPLWSYSGGSWSVKYVAASNAGPWVDVAAPGKDIYTTVRSQYSPWCYCYVGRYDGTAFGTSMAAPHVSGLAGLLFSKGSTTNIQVRKKIEETAKDLGTAGKDKEFGFGRVDALAALSRIYEETDPAITYSGSDWTSSYMKGASGNYVKYATNEDATATFSFTGKSVTWWATRSSDRNIAYVYVDGSYAGTVDLYSSTNQPRQAVFTKSWSTSGNHTIKIVTVYAIDYWAASAKADVDAFSVM